MMMNNAQINGHAFLADMYRDNYFPNFLVDKIKAILLEFCQQIEDQQVQDEAGLLRLSHAATEKINALAAEFEEHDSELETGAREAMGADFEFIVRSYGFADVDIEDVIAPRDW